MHSDSIGRKRKITLVLCNLLVILFTVAVSVVCASRLHQEQMNNKRDEFIATVESMKSVAQNYLDGERGYVENWSAYITNNRMDLPQTLEFLWQLNTNPNRYAHVVDVDTLRAIPTDSLQKSWVFPAEYQSAEVGIINRAGEYAVQSPSMRSENFLNYIRAYNFQDNYNNTIS